MFARGARKPDGRIDSTAEITTGVAAAGTFDMEL
jgi:hypothetical protein